MAERITNGRRELNPVEYNSYDHIQLPTDVASPHGLIRDMKHGQTMFVHDSSVQLFRRRHDDELRASLLTNHQIPEQDDYENMIGVTRIITLGRNAVRGYFVDLRYGDFMDSGIPVVDPTQLPETAKIYSPVPPLAIAYGENNVLFAPEAKSHGVHMESLMRQTDSRLMAANKEHEVQRNLLSELSDFAGPAVIAAITKNPLPVIQKVIEKGFGR